MIRKLLCKLGWHVLVAEEHFDHMAEIRGYESGWVEWRCKHCGYKWPWEGHPG